MIHYREYWPAFIDIARAPIEGDVETLDDVLDIAFIRERTVRGEVTCKYALSPHGTHGHLLREYNKDEWWVCATLSSDVDLVPTDKIPLWVAPPKVTIPIEPPKELGPPVPLDDLFASGVVKRTVR